MNNKLRFLVLLIFGLILSALIAKNGKLILLALPFLVYLIIGVVRAPGGMTLVAERRIDRPGVSAEELFEIHIVIRNQGNALVNLFLSDTCFSINDRAGWKGKLQAFTAPWWSNGTELCLEGGTRLIFLGNDPCLRC